MVVISSDHFSDLFFLAANRPPVTTALPTQLREIGKPVFIQLPEFADIGKKGSEIIKGEPG